jgi:hypothetical protein
VDNPFERYGLDPREGIAAITQRLKELAEEATSDAERESIRAAWEVLTLHPARRLRAALFAHPETRADLGMPPSLPRRPAGADPGAPEKLADLALRPSVLLALGPEPPKAKGGERSALLEDDPVLRGSQ